MVYVKVTVSATFFDITETYLGPLSNIYDGTCFQKQLTTKSK